MKSFNNELYVHRNETFTYDKYFVGNNGAPYIVSSKWNNPYLLFTVSSTRYEQKDRYKLNLWLDLTEGYTIDGEIFVLPRFNNTVPYKLNSWDENPSSNYPPFDPGECVYYVTDSEGNNEYRYYKSRELLDDNGKIIWYKYDFRVVVPFTQSITKDWVEQTYVYSIQLVAGDKVYTYLYNLLNSLPEVPANSEGQKYILTDDDQIVLLSDASQQQMYDYIKNINEDYVSNIRRNSVLYNYSSVQYVVTPTKIEVGSDINGGL